MNTQLIEEYINQVKDLVFELSYCQHDSLGPYSTTERHMIAFAAGRYDLLLKNEDILLCWFYLSLEQQEVVAHFRPIIRENMHLNSK